jgi:hypothetical protein
VAGNRYFEGVSIADSPHIPTEEPYACLIASGHGALLRHVTARGNRDNIFQQRIDIKEPPRLGLDC